MPSGVRRSCNLGASCAGEVGLGDSCAGEVGDC